MSLEARIYKLKREALLELCDILAEADKVISINGKPREVFQRAKIRTTQGGVLRKVYSMLQDSSKQQIERITQIVNQEVS